MSEHEPLDPELAEWFRRARPPAPPPEAKARAWARLERALPLVPPSSAPHLPSTLAKAAKALGLFVVGAAVGGGAVATLRPEPKPVTQTVYVDRYLPAPLPSLTPTPDPAPPPPAPSASSLHTPPLSSARSLAEERLLVDEARGRLSAGDPTAALQKLDEHARRFAHGSLVEEREALAVQALVNVGRYDDARARGATFRRQFPKSVFTSVIQATLDSIP